MSSNNLESLRRGNDAKPYQSQLVPHLEFIRTLRASRTPYSQISAEIETRFGLRIAPSTIHSFVRVRSVRRDVFTIAETSQVPIRPMAQINDSEVDPIERLKRSAEKIRGSTSGDWTFYNPNMPLEKKYHHHENRKK